MDAATGRQTDALTFFAELSEAPYRYDFYETLRRIECLFADRPRWGEAKLPAIRAALRGRLITGLITSEATAEQLLG